LDKDVECYNCHKKGHLAKDCWSKGGGSEGQGPRKGRGKKAKTHITVEESNAINMALTDVSYMAIGGRSKSLTKATWISNGGTTSHLATKRDMFDTYKEVSETVSGVGKSAAKIVSRGTVNLECLVNGKTIIHRLTDVLHVPEAPHCLLSNSRFDQAGGRVLTGSGRTTFTDKSGRILAAGKLVNGLYQLYAKAIFFLIHVYCRLIAFAICGPLLYLIHVHCSRSRSGVVRVGIFMSQRQRPHYWPSNGVIR
jgi:hypothetical protein